MKSFDQLRENNLTEALYDVSWGIGAEKQVVAKDAAEAIRKAKAEILRSKPKLADPKYSDTWRKNPSVHKIREDVSIRSADKKPETYIGPDGKPKTRMVPVDRKVIKTEQAENDMPASPDEKSMALDQAKFLKYVGEEITEYLNKNKEFPEWMQNKLSGLHEKAKDMHAVLAGDYEDDEEEMNEAAPKIKPDFIKTQREKDRAHDAAMGRTATGRKKPTKTMTSTQRSLAQMRGEK